MGNLLASADIQRRGDPVAIAVDHAVQAAAANKIKLDWGEDSYRKRKSYHGLVHPLYASPDRWPSVFWHPPRRMYPPVLQKKMMALATSIRRKPEWTRKIQDETIRQRWRDEAVAVGNAEGFHFPIEAAERVLESVLREAQSAGDDPTAPRPAPVSGVWESDGSVQPELLAQVQQRARELAASHPRDYHPGSDGLVIDVLHPSMACYVSGVTVIPRPVLRTVERVAFPHVEKGTVYQWLPSAVDVAADGTVRFRSCVPGFYARSANGELYATLESALTSFIPLFERVLHTVRHPQLRDDFNVQLGDADEETMAGYGEHEDGTFYQFEVEDGAVVTKTGMIGTCGTTETRTFTEEDDTYDLFEEHQENLERNGYKLMLAPELRPKVTPFTPPELHAPVSLRGRRLQVITKIASIELTPEKPRYGGGAWHVEGEPQECIVATGILYFDSHNITASTLRFRAGVDEEMEIYRHEDPNVLAFDIDGDGDSELIIPLGCVDCIQGRSIAFPNTFQHHVDAFELADKTRPGHRKILAFFLVDPSVPVLSTVELPLLRHECLIAVLIRCDRFDNIPIELIEKIVLFVRGVHGFEDAAVHRAGLMDMRRSANDRLDGLFVNEDFSLCEH